jgi:hypothetical protein
MILWVAYRDSSLGATLRVACRDSSVGGEYLAFLGQTTLKNVLINIGLDFVYG